MRIRDCDYPCDCFGRRLAHPPKVRRAGHENFGAYRDTPWRATQRRSSRQGDRTTARPAAINEYDIVAIHEDCWREV